MVVGGFSPYHRLQTDDTPSKRIVSTPTSGGIIGVVGLVVTKPKPPIFQCYLHTACVKVFFRVRQLTVCHEYALILYIFRLLNPLLTPHKSLPASGRVRGCVAAVVFNIGSTNNQLIRSIKNKRIAVAGQRSRLNNLLLPFGCQLVRQ